MNAEIDTPQVAAEPRVGRSTDPLDVLREVLELQRESNPSLDVQEMLAHAVTHPNAEVVDSLGAVSVVCALYDAYSADNLIPQRLLTHENFTTLSGLTKVVRELDRKAGHR
jgi:hypothetical protein